MTTLHFELPHSQRPFGPEGVLLFYDGPQLFWLELPLPGRCLCLGLPDEAGHWAFLVVVLSENQAEALLNDTMTLLQACLQASHAYLLPDYDADVLELQLLTTIPDAWLPGDVHLKMPKNNDSSSL